MPKENNEIIKNRELIKSSNQFPVVGIGASAGGLDAFKKLLKAIPENSGMAFVLVQHLDPKHESLLPELLQKVTSIPVLEISDDIKVVPDHIYIIPSNKMLLANDGVLQLSPRSSKIKTERNLPIDLFFASLAEVHQSHAIGVVLSGTASDGTLGLKAIKDYGGITFAQDEASAAYEGMPHSAIQAGVVDFILPPENIPQKLLEITRRIALSDDELENVPQQDDEVFKQIISLLRIRKGTDFTYYKQTTIRRRILRRMAFNKNEEPAAYLKYLRENKPEQDILYQDLLIPVTNFFRDPKTFDNLCETVFPLIAKNKTASESIRIWVAGCSTGEEAYSIAICLKEFLGDLPHPDSFQNSKKEGLVQIFATDISEPAIAKARAGSYTKNEISGLTQQRLQEFFTKTNGSYQVNKQIRDMCVFAVHNFLKDSPFGKMDFISCRNVLIYMEPFLQKKTLTTFHYSLNPKGFLLLGKSETTSGVTDLFASAALKDKLFTRKNVPGRFMHVASQRSEQNLSYTDTNSKNEIIRTDFQKTADDIMLSRYTPAGVVVNEAMDIVHFRGNTAAYLEQSPGKPSHNLLKMAKDGLAFELRNILHKAKKVNVPVIKENIPLQVNGNLRTISIEAILLPNMAEPHYLILFHDNDAARSQKSGVRSQKTTAKIKKDDKDIRIQQLEQDLAHARDDMRSITEEQEAANEELQSANEELLSGSEELQSLNEELETNKEELQSTNEELTVVNQEMISLNEQVTAARYYAEAIVATVREPLLVLDKNLRVITANSSYYTSFRVNEPETEGRLIYALGNKEWDIPALRELLEKILPEKTTFRDFEITQTFSSIGKRIMVLNAREVINKNSLEKLILLSIEDITEKAIALRKIEESEKRYKMMFMQSPFAFAVFKGKDMVITLANDTVKEVWGKGYQIEGKPLFQVLPEIKDGPVPALLDKVYTTGIPYYGYELLIPLQRKGNLEDVYFNFIYQPYREADETISGVTVIAYEVTNEVLAKKRIEESQALFHFIADSVPQKVWTADAEGNYDYFNKCWFDYTGLTFEELKAWGWEKIVHPDDWEENKKQWQQSIDSGNNFELENRFLNKDGEYLWHLSRGLANKDENGKIKMWIGSNTEIHEQKKQKEELEKAVVKRTYELQQVYAEKEKRAAELLIANKELVFQSAEKEKRAAELIIANKELVFQSAEKEKRAAELIIANKELVFQSTEKEKRAAELIIANKELQQKNQEIALSKYNKRFLTEFSEKFSAYKLHNEFFNSLIQFIADTTGMDYVFVGKLVENEKDQLTIQTIALTAFGKITENINYPLPDGPCEQVIRGTLYSYPNQCRQTFPKNKTIEQFNVEGYLAYPLNDEEGKVVGLIAVMHQKEIEDAETVSSVLKIVAKRAEIELERIKNEEQLVQHNTILEEKNEELVKMNKELQAFTYVSSHDLQEPLRKIQNFISHLLEKENQNLSDKANDYFRRIQESAKRMQTLIQDLLAFSHINNTERIFEKTSLDTIIAKVKADLAETIKEKNATIEASEICEAKIIPFLFHQLFYNLISNSIKFSIPGKAAHIIIKCKIDEGINFNNDRLSPKKRYCHISLTDNGIGFDPEYKDRIFELFQRLHSKEKYPGTGVGLAIVKKIVDNHNGIITASSGINQGARFDIYIPA